MRGSSAGRINDCIATPPKVLGENRGQHATAHCIEGLAPQSQASIANEGTTVKMFSGLGQAGLDAFYNGLMASSSSIFTVFLGYLFFALGRFIRKSFHGGRRYAFVLLSAGFFCVLAYLVSYSDYTNPEMRSYRDPEFYENQNELVHPIESATKVFLFVFVLVLAGSTALDLDLDLPYEPRTESSEI